MKAAGIATIALGALAAFTLALLPVHISLLGTTVSCGPPAVMALAGVLGGSPPSADVVDAVVVDQCVSDSLIRCYIGFAALVITAGAGSIMLVVARR